MDLATSAMYIVEWEFYITYYIKPKVDWCALDSSDVSEQKVKNSIILLLVCCMMCLI